VAAAISQTAKVTISVPLTSDLRAGA